MAARKTRMVKPIHNRVIILPDTPEERTRSGIILPQTAREKPSKGTVVAVGPGQYEFGVFITPSVKVRDKVTYSNRIGTELEHNGITHIVMRDTDIFGII